MSPRRTSNASLHKASSSDRTTQLVTRSPWRAMHSNKSVLMSPFPSSVAISPSFFFFTGDFTRHRATSANECATFHAQSQHPRRAPRFHRLGLGKGSVGAQGSRSYWPSSLEDLGARPRNEGHPRDGFAGAGSSGYWCDASRVCIHPWFPDLWST